MTTSIESTEGPSAAPPLEQDQRPLFELASAASPFQRLAFMADGTVKRVASGFTLEPIIRRAIGPDDGYQFRLPLMVGRRSEVVLHPGLFIISGATGVGKSRLLRALAGRVNGVRLNVVEPYDTVEEINTLPDFQSVDEALVYAVRALKPGTLPMIDSLRSMLYELKGAAGPKGVVAVFFSVLTRVSNALAQSGFTVIATVNPMVSDPDYVTEFHQKLSSSVPGYVWLTGVRGSADQETYTGKISLRSKEATSRQELDFEFNTKGEILAPEPVDFPVFKPFDEQGEQLSAQTRSALLNATNL